MVVGGLEHAYYPPEGLAKIPKLPGLAAAYDRDGVRIYEVDQRELEEELGR